MSVLDREGREAKMTRTRLQESTVLSFRPDKEQFIDGQIGDYTLALRMNRNGKPGVPYKIRTTLKVGDRPIGEAEAADALLSVVPAAGPPE